MIAQNAIVFDDMYRLHRFCERHEGGFCCPHGSDYSNLDRFFIPAGNLEYMHACKFALVMQVSESKVCENGR